MATSRDDGGAPGGSAARGAGGSVPAGGSVQGGEPGPAGDLPPATDTYGRTLAGVARLVEAITPWLLDLGSWIFGALIAFNLVILGALLTIGPVDLQVELATAALALALPPNVAGFALLRLTADMRKVSLPEVAIRAMREAGFSVQGAEPRRDAERRERWVVLRYSYALLLATILLTIAGVALALWHSAGWIAAAFVAMVAISVGVMLRAISELGARGTWQTPAGEAESGFRR